MAYLKRAVDSVLRQTDPRWGLLVCDDAGPDGGVADLLAGYGDPRVRYHRNPTNLGMAGNWNRCLDLADADLVVLLHQDDELLENYVALMLAAAEAHPKAAAFFCPARVIDAGGARRFSLPDFVKQFFVPGGTGPIRLRGDRGLAAVLRGNFIMCPTVCYRKSVLAGRRFGGAWKFAQDLDFFVRLLLDGDELVGLRQEGYAYRRHGDNATVRYTANLLRFREELSVYGWVSRAAAGRGWERAARAARGKTIVKLNLGFCSLVDLCRGQWGPAARKLAFLGQAAG
jgi:glycosyltransferase involved in cell wall biosynthesis